MSNVQAGITGLLKIQWNVKKTIDCVDKMDWYLFDAIVLIDVPRPGVGSLERMYPDKLNVVDEIAMLTASSTPLVSGLKPIVFTFNAGKYFCYSLYCERAGGGFVVSILSMWPFAFFYTMFLKAVVSEFNENGGIVDSGQTFEYVKSLMQQWPYYYEATLQFLFPLGEIEFEFDIEHFTFAQFNPCLFFSVDECKRLWKAMLLNEPILFVVPNGVYACRCCFSAMALLAPLQGKAPFAIWVMPTDPRFKELVEGRSDLKMVACAADYVGEWKKHFKHVFRIGEKLRGNSDCEVRKAFKQLMMKLLVVLQEEIDSQISQDPYFNVTKKSLMTQHFRTVYKSQAKRQQLLPVHELELFLSTKSFEHWRYRSDGADRFRDALLSMAPTIDMFTNRPEEELRTILAAIEKSKIDFAHDAHVMAVLKRHEDAVTLLLHK